MEIGISLALKGGVTATFLPSDLPNLAAWYRFNRNVAAGQWNDASGNTRHLIQGTGANQPAVQGDGSLLFDGTSDFMQATFTLNQPHTLYLLAKQISWTAGDLWTDGVTAAGARFEQDAVGATPQLAIVAGSRLRLLAGPVLNTYGVLTGVFNGASSAVRLNNAAAVVGNGGANNAGGLTLGANAAGAVPSNIQVKEFIAYTGAHDTAAQDQVIAYLQGL